MVLRIVHMIVKVIQKEYSLIQLGLIDINKKTCLNILKIVETKRMYWFGWRFPTRLINPIRHSKIMVGEWKTSCIRRIAKSRNDKASITLYQPLFSCRPSLKTLIWGSWQGLLSCSKNGAESILDLIRDLESWFFWTTGRRNRRIGSWSFGLATLAS